MRILLFISFNLNLLLLTISCGKTTKKPMVTSAAIAASMSKITYESDAFIFTKNTSVGTINPSDTAGEITACKATPSLPAGLLLSAACVITGTPAEVTASTDYSIAAINVGADISVSQINITVKEEILKPVISFAGGPFVFVENTPIATLSPSSTGGAIISCKASPSLPSGLLLSSSCVITGKPTTPTAVANYNITAHNAAGDGNVL